jgi:hypothetical protein
VDPPPPPPPVEPPPPTAAGPAPGTVFTTRGQLYLTGGTDILYENVRFQGSGYGSGDWGALVFLLANAPLKNIVFRNCIIGRNMDGSGNGVKVVDLGGGRVDGILFDHCHFEYQPRMGFEVNGRSRENGVRGLAYQRVNLTNCTFDASAGEAISYDDDVEAVSESAGNCLISGNVVQGAGVGNSYVWGKVFEINGPMNMTVTDNFFGAGRDGIMNLQGRTGAHEQWTFKGNVIDGTHVPSGVGSSGSQLYYCKNIVGGVTAADTIVNGRNFTSGSWGWMENARGMDFGASTVKGAPAAPWGTSSGCIWPKAV